jgi:hypothetical protein
MIDMLFPVDKYDGHSTFLFITRDGYSVFRVHKITLHDGCLKALEIIGEYEYLGTARTSIPYGVEAIPTSELHRDINTRNVIEAYRKR